MPAPPPQYSLNARALSHSSASTSRLILIASRANRSAAFLAVRYSPVMSAQAQLASTSPKPARQHASSPASTIAERTNEACPENANAMGLLAIASTRRATSINDSISCTASSTRSTRNRMRTALSTYSGWRCAITARNLPKAASRSPRQLNSSVSGAYTTIG